MELDVQVKQFITTVGDIVSTKWRGDSKSSGYILSDQSSIGEARTFKLLNLTGESIAFEVFPKDKYKLSLTPIGGGNVVSLRHTGSIRSSYYIVCNDNYLINMGTDSFRYRNDGLVDMTDLLLAIENDKHASLVEIYDRDDYELNLVEKGAMI